MALRATRAASGFLDAAGEGYGFSLLLYFWDLLDDGIDLFFWCDWIC